MFTCFPILSFSLLFIGAVVVALPTSCTEDAQCSTGFYCNINTRACHRCVSCVDYGRLDPDLSADCVKHPAQCGSCFKGLIKVYEDIIAAKCMPPDVQRSKHSQVYLWSSAMVAGILVVITFLHVLRSTSVYRIVACFTFAQGETTVVRNAMDIEIPLV